MGNKRALCLGGAKNHLIVMPDAEVEQSSTDILNSFAGSTGQRCMAASVLVVVGDNPETHPVVLKLIEKARAVKPGQTGAGEIGPVIDLIAVNRIHRYVSESVEKYGSKLLVDGREWTKNQTRGFWVGPTIILHDMQRASGNDPALTDEIFGPVISVVNVATLQDAIILINQSSFGNAACIYTRSGLRLTLSLGRSIQACSGLTSVYLSPENRFRSVEPSAANSESVISPGMDWWSSVLCGVKLL